MLAKLGTKASNQGPVPMMLIRMEAYGPRFVSVCVDLLLASPEEPQRGVELLERVADLGLVVGGQHRAARLPASRALTSSEWMASRRVISSWKTSSPCFISVTRSPRRSREQLGDPLGAAEQLLDRLVPGGDGAGRCRERPVNVDLMCGLAALTVSPSVVRAWESCGMLMASVRGGQLAERGDDVVAAVGAADRDGVAALHLAAALGGQLEVLLAQQVQHLHRRLGLVAQRRRP